MAALRPGTQVPTPINGTIAAPRSFAVGSKVAIPKAMRVVRAGGRREVTLTSAEVPLIHPKDSDEKQIQYALLARVRVFDLSDPKDVAAAELVWQSIAAKNAVWSEDKTAFDETRGKFYQYIRWSDLVHALPGQVDAALAVARAEIAAATAAG